MVDSRLIEVTATLIKELSSGWAKDGRGHLERRPLTRGLIYNSFLQWFQDFGYWPLSKGWSLNRQAVDEVQLSIPRKTPKLFLWDGVWVLTVYNRFLGLKGEERSENERQRRERNILSFVCPSPLRPLKISFPITPKEGPDTYANLRLRNKNRCNWYAHARKHNGLMFIII